MAIGTHFSFFGNQAISVLIILATVYFLYLLVITLTLIGRLISGSIRFQPLRKILPLAISVAILTISQIRRPIFVHIPNYTHLAMQIIVSPGSLRAAENSTKCQKIKSAFWANNTFSFGGTIPQYRFLVFDREFDIKFGIDEASSRWKDCLLKSPMYSEHNYVVFNITSSLGFGYYVVDVADT